MKNKDVVVVIPTLNPNEKIMSEFMDKLVKSFKNIVVVNDGSRDSYEKYFKSFEKQGIVVLKHHINYGKGRALKTALNYILNEYKDIKAIITADSDGQHSPEDIEKVAEKTKKNPDAYVLGSRNFKQDNVPFKSRYGNIITRNVFKIFVGLNITDTQTGLRGMSPEVAKKFLATTGERFEYETNTLIECKEKDIPIVEETIKTIYIVSISLLIVFIRIFSLLLKRKNFSLILSYHYAYLYRKIITFFLLSTIHPRQNEVHNCKS